MSLWEFSAVMEGFRKFHSTGDEHSPPNEDEYWKIVHQFA